MSRRARGDRPRNGQVAGELGCDRHTVATWRRFLDQGLAGLQDRPRSWRPRSFSPEQRATVLALASELPATADCSATRRNLDDLARHLVNDHARESMSRATNWRTLDAADLKPHKSLYWLNCHDPDQDSNRERLVRSER